MTDPTTIPRTREWLDANGRSSFAMGTASLCLTRRYHGLLCTTKNESERYVLVASIDEQVGVGDRRYTSTTTAFESSTREGEEGLRSFSNDPWPTWLYDVGEVRLQRSLFVAHDSPSTVLTYEHVEGPACVLEVRPLLAMRNAHQVHAQRDTNAIQLESWTGKITVTASDPQVPSLTIVHDGELVGDVDVWRGFHLAKEAERGLEASQDLLTPGVIRMELPVGGKVSMVFTTKSEGFFDLDAMTAREVEHRATRAAGVHQGAEDLVRAARNYRVGARGDSAITAGFPWYGVRTREALFSLPGLFLSANDFTSAKDLLLLCAERMRGGLLPSRLDDGTHQVYEVDTALYFVECVRLYTEHAGTRLEDRLYEKCLEVVASCASGTMHVNLHSDGLLSIDEGGPSTWMNAVVDGVAVTKRHGKPVEVQALWYNALMVTADLALTRRATVMASEMRGLARRVGEHFQKLFWNEDRGFCADLVESKNGSVVRDMSMRPNQLFAASLCYPILTPDKAASMLEHVHEELVTERGLRTLAVNEEGFVGRVPTNESDRHRAMHQGAAWPWLIGPYCRALVFAHGQAAVRAEVERVLKPLMESATQEGLWGHIAECYDALGAQEPHGAPAYALGLAEVLRVHEEILNEKAIKERISSPPVRLAPLSMLALETDGGELVEAAPVATPTRSRRKKS